MPPHTLSSVGRRVTAAHQRVRGGGGRRTPEEAVGFRPAPLLPTPLTRAPGAPLPQAAVLAAAPPAQQPALDALRELLLRAAPLDDADAAAAAFVITP